MATNLAQKSIDAALRNPQLIAAAQALFENRLHDAEPILKGHLKVNPFDVAAIRMLAELAARIGRFKDSENLLHRALELAPEFVAARSNLATVLHRQGRSGEALKQLEKLQKLDPGNLGHTNLRAAALGRVGEFDEALSLYEQLIRQFPNQPKIWMSYGHLLKTVGQLDEAVSSYRQALTLSPAFGEIWWSLANLKTFKFNDADIHAMKTALAKPDISPEDQFHLHFALGKAEENQANAIAAFRNYETGNMLRKELIGYNSEQTTTAVKKCKRLYSRELYTERSGQGDPSTDPIFIVGMPRAGSTLIEQILSSHSMVEGTMELPDIPKLLAKAMNMGGIKKLRPDEIKSLGQEYLQGTYIQRKTDRPFFIDKLPNNWLHVGFIHLILPNAKIIDARRHPLDCGYSNFRQHFARGQAFSYNLTDIGRYYADYVDLMTHFDKILPQCVHRVIHEQIIENTEAEVRALLNYLSIPFEENCLKFYENDRAVRTPSSEQVRRPINRDGIGRWRDVEHLIGPLKDALGEVLTYYPDAP